MSENDTHTTNDTDVQERLDRLETLLEEQRETIAAQQRRLAHQGAVLEQAEPAPEGAAESDPGVESDPDAESEGRSATLPVDRRGVLKTGGLLGLVGLATGTAAAAPGNSGNGGGSGNATAINWADDDGDGLLEPTDASITGIDVDDVEADSLDGGVTGGTRVTSLLGDGLTISNSALTAALGNALSFDTNGRIALQPGTVDHDSLSGIDSDDHHTRPQAGDGLTDDSNTFNIEPGDFAGSALEDDGNDNLAVASGAIDDDELAESSVTVAGNTVSLGGSTGVGHGDLDGIGASDHHTRPTAGNALADNSNTFDVQESSIDHNNLTNGGQSDAHHARPSAGDGLIDDSNVFKADLNQVGSGTGVLGGVGGDGVDYRSLSGSDGVSVSENGGTVTLGVAGTETDTASTFTESDLSLSTSDTTVNDGAVELVTDKTVSVSRPDDDRGNEDILDKTGIVFKPKIDLSEITLTVSSMTSGETTVYVTETDGTVLDSTKSPGAGNSVTLSPSLSAGTEYYAVVDAGGLAFTAGQVTASFPYTSSAIDITEGVFSAGQPDEFRSITALTISKLEVTVDSNSGTATAEWSQPSSVSRWDTASYQYDPDGETVEVYVEVNDGSGWSDWGTNPIGPGTDLSGIPAGDRVRLRAELSRDDTSNNPRVTLLSRQYRP